MGIERWFRNDKPAGGLIGCGDTNRGSFNQKKRRSRGGMILKATLSAAKKDGKKHHSELSTEGKKAENRRTKAIVVKNSANLR